MKKCRARYGLEQQQLWWELSSSKSKCYNHINNRSHDLETQVQTLQKKEEVCKSSDVSAREVKLSRQLKVENLMINTCSRQEHSRDRGH